MRPQLLLLPSYAGTGIAERARDAWTGLSRAAHHHAYELAPTAAELRSWHSTVSQPTRDLAMDLGQSDATSAEGSRSSPSTVGIKGSACIVDGQKIIIDPLVILGACLIGNCCRERG